MIPRITQQKLDDLALQYGNRLLADVQRVFARKYKADNPLIQGLGDTGVGMSIAKALVEAMGGRIWAESLGLGRGSSFAFTLLLWADTAPA